MRAILAIAIGAMFLALATEYWIPDDKPIPLALRIIIGLFSTILVWAGLYHGRLRLRRRRAYRVGREQHGEISLLKLLGDEDSIAEVRFTSRAGSWSLAVDAAGVDKTLLSLDESARATAYFGDDDLIYAIDMQGKRLLPISPGKPLSPDFDEALRARQLRRDKAQRTGRNG